MLVSPIRVWSVRAATIVSLALPGQLVATEGGSWRGHQPVTKLAFHPEVPELHPNLARGLGIGRAFDGDGTQQVNLFNGNLVVRVPLGTYPVNARLSYALGLTYNASIWNFRGADLAAPRAATNAGAGWDLSLGRLLAPGSSGNETARWQYISPDGAPHLFYDDVHWDTPDSNDPGGNVQYTRDGTYLRLVVVSPDEIEVQQRDGTHRVFRHTVEGWRLSGIGVAGVSPRRLVEIAYGGDGSWTIEDVHGRTHRVIFRADPTGTFPGLIDRVEIAASHDRTAIYQFGYDVIDAPYPCADPRENATAIPVLTELIDPTSATRGFTYHDVGTGATCANGGRLRSADLSWGGRLEWDYAADYWFPSPTCPDNGPGSLRRVSGVVERRSVLPDDSVVGTWRYQPEIPGVPTPQPSDAGCGWHHRLTRVVDPLGHMREHHFSIATQDSALGRLAEYAMPFTRTEADTTGTRYLSTRVPGLRSTFVRWEQDEACTVATGNCLDTNRRLESIRVRHDDDIVAATGEFRHGDTDYQDYDGLGHFRVMVESGNFEGNNHLLRTTDYNPARGTYLARCTGSCQQGFVPPPTDQPWAMEVFGARLVDDGAGSTRRRDTCFDAFGQRLRERFREDGDRGSHDVVVEVLWVDGNPTEVARHGGDRQTVSTSPNLCSIALGSADSRERSAYAHGSLALLEVLDATGPAPPLSRLDRDIDPNTGLILVKRGIDGLETAYEYDLLGQVVWEKPEALDGSAWIQYLRRGPTGGSTWKDGVQVTTHHRPNGGVAKLQTSIAWHDLFGHGIVGEQTNDVPGTGHSRVRRDFDPRGNLIRESTPFLPGAGAAWTQYLDYDAFGRPQIIRPPEGASQDQVLARKGESETTITSWAAKAFQTGLCYEETETTRLVYDRQGRLARVESDRPWPLPGETREVRHQYDATGRQTVATSVREVSGAASQTTRAQEWDGRGFLKETFLWELGGDSTIVTYSNHDTAGRAGRKHTQNALHPSPGTAVEMAHDAYGRLVSIADGNDPAKIWKVFAYHEENVPSCQQWVPAGCETANNDDGGCACIAWETSEARRGKLATATRYNYFAPHDSMAYRVEDLYAYGGVGGRRSEKTTTITDPLGNVLRRSVTGAAYDALGQVAETTYPRCVAGCATAEPSLIRSVATSHAGTFVTAIASDLDGMSQGWVDAISYHPDGSRHQVNHGNGVVDTFAADPWGRGFSTREETIGAHIAYDSGPIIHDGAGRVCGRGDTSLVAAPIEPDVGGGSVVLSCGPAVDPFDRFDGEMIDPACGPGGQVKIVHDAADLPVLRVDTSHRKQYWDGQAWQCCVNDVDRWYREWYQSTLVGGITRTVRERYDGSGWSWTQDVIPGAGRERHDSDGTAERWHLHNTGSGATNAAGEAAGGNS